MCRDSLYRVYTAYRQRKSVFVQGIGNSASSSSAIKPESFTPAPRGVPDTDVWEVGGLGEREGVVLLCLTLFKVLQL